MSGTITREELEKLYTDNIVVTPAMLEERRRVTTRLGYKLGGLGGMVATIVALLTLAAIAGVAFVIMISTSSLTMDQMAVAVIGYVGAVFGLIVLTPFAFFKRSRAVIASGVILAILGVFAGAGIWMYFNTGF